MNLLAILDGWLQNRNGPGCASNTPPTLDIATCKRGQPMPVVANIPILSVFSISTNHERMAVKP
jgi:hypothetical protein